MSPPPSPAPLWPKNREDDEDEEENCEEFCRAAAASAQQTERSWRKTFIAPNLTVKKTMKKQEDKRKQERKGQVERGEAHQQESKPGVTTDTSRECKSKKRKGAGGGEEREREPCARVRREKKNGLLSIRLGLLVASTSSTNPSLHWIEAFVHAVTAASWSRKEDR